FAGRSQRLVEQRGVVARSNADRNVWIRSYGKGVRSALISAFKCEEAAYSPDMLPRRCQNVTEAILVTAKRIGREMVLSLIIRTLVAGMMRCVTIGFQKGQPDDPPNSFWTYRTPQHPSHFWCSGAQQSHSGRGRSHPRLAAGIRHQPH